MVAEHELLKFGSPSGLEEVLTVENTLHFHGLLRVSSFVERCKSALLGDYDQTWVEEILNKTRLLSLCWTFAFCIEMQPLQQVIQQQ